MKGISFYSCTHPSPFDVLISVTGLGNFPKYLVTNFITKVA